MAEKVTWMVRKVDLQCSSCYMKVKKILCKFPQIRDQVYDEQKNLVRITVVCCSPEKIRDKLCCKGGKVIQSIEIREPGTGTNKNTPPDPVTPKKTPTCSGTRTCTPKNTPTCSGTCSCTPKKAPTCSGICTCTPKNTPTCSAPIIPVPVRFCCRECYDGYAGGPCYHWHGSPAPPPPPPCYDYYYYGYGKGCYVSRCDYFSEENITGCRIV